MATYNVHAGHCPQGHGASGACGYLKESIEDRLVKDALISKLKSAGHTVYDCTDNSNCTASQNLKNIVTKCNAHRVDLDISIHLNAGGGTGVETLIYNEKTKAIATKISQEISSALGITNRGVKTRTGLYVLRHTNAPALLVECCFVDSQNDYNKWNVEKCAEAIYRGITGQSSTDVKEEGWQKNDTGWWYQHSDGSYTTNGWEKINGNWYYFDGNGYMYEEGWHQIGGVWYHIDKWGAMHTKWQYIDNEWYYMDESGAMLSGWQLIDSNWYYLNENHDGDFGKMLTGWQSINGNWFYLKSDGSMANHEWYKDENENWFWLKDGGYMAHDEIVWIGDRAFAFLSDGHMGRTDENGALY